MSRNVSARHRHSSDRSDRSSAHPRGRQWFRRSRQLASTGCALVLASLLFLGHGAEAGDTPTGSIFTYQGQLRNGDTTVTDSVDLRFTLWTGDSEEAVQVGDTLEVTDVSLVDGLFTVDLDFGAGAFAGKERWLEIAVRIPHDPAGAAPFTTLEPRQPLYATPYALHALSTSSVGDGSLSGTYTGIIQFANPANTYTGNGSGLTGLNAANITLGKLSNAVLPSGGDWSLSENLSINGGTILVDRSTNRVSIGSAEAAPERSLHVVGEGGNNVNGLRLTHPEIPANWDLLIGGPANSFPGGFAIARDGSASFTITDENKVGVGTTTPTTKLHVRGFGQAMGHHVAFFDNLGTLGADGIAIRVGNPKADMENNYVTFFNGNNQVTGRIEGFQWLTDWEEPPTLTIAPPSVNIPFNPGSLPSAIFSTGSLPSLVCETLEVFGQTVLVPPVLFSAGSLPSLNFNAGQLPSVGTPSINWPLPSLTQLKNYACWAFEGGFPELLAIDPVSIAAASIRKEASMLCKDNGVVYGSKGADYAEWLPKLDPNEKFQFGQIVGVHGGKVSLVTDGADQIMALSANPVVLGNMPEEGDEENWVAVGFMGQVPVTVRGVVHPGDYILPSGLNDGTGIAIAPEDLTLEHIDQVLGRAWSGSKNAVISVINVAVGLNTRDAARVLHRQNDRISELLDTNARLLERLEALDARLSTLEARR